MFDANREAFQSGSRTWFTEYERSGLDGGSSEFGNAVKFK